MHDNVVVRDLVRDAWTAYALPRFGLESAKGRKEWAAFCLHATEAYIRLRDRAKEARGTCDYDAADLQLYILRTLDAPCQFCGKLFGLDTFAVTYVMPPGRGDSNGKAREWARRNPWRLTNLAVCCDVCEGAKGDLSSAEWIEMLAALNAAETHAATATVDALLRGRGREDVLRAAIRRRGRSPGVEGTSDGVAGCE